MPDIPDQEEESWTVLNLDSGDILSVELPVLGTGGVVGG